MGRAKVAGGRAVGGSFLFSHLQPCGAASDVSINSCHPSDPSVNRYAIAIRSTDGRGGVIETGNGMIPVRIMHTARKIG